MGRYWIVALTVVALLAASGATAAVVSVQIGAESVIVGDDVSAWGCDPGWTASLEVVGSRDATATWIGLVQRRHGIPIGYKAGYDPGTTGGCAASESVPLWDILGGLRVRFGGDTWLSLIHI